MKILNYTIFLSNPILLPIFLNSIYIITIDTTPAIKSAIGPEYIIPSIPINNGNTKTQIETNRSPLQKVIIIKMAGDKAYKLVTCQNVNLKLF